VPAIDPVRAGCSRTGLADIIQSAPSAIGRSHFPLGTPGHRAKLPMTGLRWPSGTPAGGERQRAARFYFGPGHSTRCADAKSSLRPPPCLPAGQWKQLQHYWEVDAAASISLASMPLLQQSLVHLFSSPVGRSQQTLSHDSES